ncbi:hypothetical protein NQ314_014199 [Rhamnusium bicolor]|uniref:Uncharacterized protein n=1 Tax=Rhamnusium bicolor TaxID=1586634 RepID=A0AAV8X3Z4_9CUCU|nr:hypothetical protein NQ314_014199 [Rhamnusium bicolor]
MSFDLNVTPVLLKGELFVGPEDSITDAKLSLIRPVHGMLLRRTPTWRRQSHFMKCFLQKEPNYCAVSRKATIAEVTDFKNRLNSFVVGFTWLLQAEPKETLLLLVPQIENIVFSPEYIDSENKVEYFKEKCMLY